MENMVKEDVFQALTEFGRKGDSPIPDLLEDYLRFVANTGDTVFPWAVIKTLVRRKIEQVLSEFRLISSPESVLPSPNVDPFKYALMREKILEALEYFTQAPFTIQRLCEVIVEPTKYYKRIDKFMRAIEKNLLVTTTVDPRRPGSPNGKSGGPHGSAVANGYEDRANGHHTGGRRGTPEGTQHNPADRASTGSVLDEEEPMDITGPPAPQPHAVLDCPAEAMEGCEDECGEDIDVDQDNSQQADTSSQQATAVTGCGLASVTPTQSDGDHSGGQQPLGSSSSSGAVVAGAPNVQETTAAATAAAAATAGAAQNGGSGGGAGGGGGSSQENLLHIQQQMREQQQQQQQLMAMTGFDAAATTTTTTPATATPAAAAAAGSSKAEGPGSGTAGSEPGTIGASSAGGLGSGSGQSGPAAALNGEDSCSDVEAEGESEQDMMMLMMRGSREESTPDNELEQQVPQFGSCESGESGGLSPVQFQSVSSQSSQDTKKNGQSEQHHTSSSSATSASTSETTTSAMATLSQGSPGVDQSSLVESSQQLTTDGDSNSGDCSTNNNEARATQHDEQDEVVGRDTSRESRNSGGSEAVALSGDDQNNESNNDSDTSTATATAAAAAAASGSRTTPSRGQTTLAEDTQEGSIGQSSEQSNASTEAGGPSVSRITKASTGNVEAGQQLELDTTGSPSSNEAVAKE